jgi:exosome complex exonuclease DIS3/RRP44
LLSDDRRNREIAQAEGLIAISTREYVDGLEPEEREKLVDLVVGGVDEVAPSERRAKRIYQEVNLSPPPLQLIADDQYLPQDVLTAGVKSGRYFQGHYNANQYNYLEVSSIE